MRTTHKVKSRLDRRVLALHNLAHCPQHLLDMWQLCRVFADIAVADCPGLIDNEHGTDDRTLIAASIDARVHDTVGRSDLSG